LKVDHKNEKENDDKTILLEEEKKANQNKEPGRLPKVSEPPFVSLWRVFSL
jgi:hypothetical protein